MNIKKLTYLSFLSAVGVIGRLLFVFIPNVQPVTSILIFTAIYFNLIDAILVNIVIIFVSNLFLGSGIWNIYQTITYGIIIIIASILKRNKNFKDKILYQGIFACISGFLYGFIISIFTSAMFSKTSNFWAYYIFGLQIDTYHAIGNLTVYIVLIPILLKITNKYFNDNK